MVPLERLFPGAAIMIRRDGRADGHGRHADDDGHAARADRVEDLERGLLAADGVERVVHAAASGSGSRTRSTMLSCLPLKVWVAPNSFA